MDRVGGDGAWDMSTVLSDGIPRYQVRTLTATLERSDGNRESREYEIRDMINTLDGQQWDIYLPDDVDRYVVGRVNVARNYSDLVHASVTITAMRAVEIQPIRYGTGNHCHVNCQDSLPIQRRPSGRCSDLESGRLLCLGVIGLR